MQCNPIREWGPAPEADPTADPRQFAGAWQAPDPTKPSTDKTHSVRPGRFMTRSVSDGNPFQVGEHHSRREVSTTLRVALEEKLEAIMEPNEMLLDQIMGLVWSVR